MNPPSLGFQYELLERLHEDLLDVLILSSDEIKKDRKKILLTKVHGLLEEYGLVLDLNTLFNESISILSGILSTGHVSIP